MCYRGPVPIRRSAEFWLQFVAKVRNWPVYAFNRLIPVEYHLRQGGIRLCIRPQDRCAFNDVFITGQYNVAVPWKSFQRLIDIGANVGAFTAFASTMSPQARFESIEPEESNFAQLQRNIALNGIRAVCRQAVVSASSGKRQLFLHERAGQHSLFATGKSVSVDSIQLAELLGEPCDLLKMDCEGAEYEIVYSLPVHLWKNVRYIVLEYHYPNSTDSPVNLRRYFENLGYRVTIPGRRILLAERA
jgi:FkbM family methyltransferase